YHHKALLAQLDYYPKSSIGRQMSGKGKMVLFRHGDLNLLRYAFIDRYTKLIGYGNLLGKLRIWTDHSSLSPMLQQNAAVGLNHRFTQGMQQPGNLMGRAAFNPV